MKSETVIDVRSRFACEVHLLQCDSKQKAWDRLSVLWEWSWTSLRAAFPERQIIIRTDGRVRFFVLGSLLQIVMAGSTLLLGAFVVFISIDDVVQSGINVTEHNHLREVQALNDATNAAIHDLEAQQDALAAMIERKEKVESVLRSPSSQPGANSARVTASSQKHKEAAETVPDTGEAVVMGPARVSAVAPQLDPVQPWRESFVRGAIRRFAEFLRGISGVAGAPDQPPHEPQPSPLMVLKARQLMLLRNVARSLDTDSKRFRQALQNIGFAREGFLARAKSPTTDSVGTGDPLSFPESVTDISDLEYLSQLQSAANSLDMLSNVGKQMNAVPWLRPIDVDYGTASGFGVRRDPFTKRLAFHSGLDLSGPRGSPVRATAPGIVIYAGRKGAYGNMIEIDHGYGIRTRYGHLRSTSVPVGAIVERGTPVGSLGSTGRSTGPHVHYEVWYGNSARDPKKFIKAGQILLQE
jgi:murein DD-endopeptidase MepM/ murein hydrolase activator NlpD